MNLATAIQQVNDSEQSRASVISIIFNNESLRSIIFKYILQHGGNNDDAQHIYNEMIVQFIKTAFGKKAQAIEDGHLDAYLITIAKYLWYGEYKRKRKEYEYESLSIPEDIVVEPEELYMTSEKYILLKEILDKLRTNCRAVLMHWANGFSMKEIAEKIGYQSEGMARKKKSQCMAELNEYLMNHPHIKNALQ